MERVENGKFKLIPSKAWECECEYVVITGYFAYILLLGDVLIRQERVE